MSSVAEVFSKNELANIPSADNKRQMFFTF